MRPYFCLIALFLPSLVLSSQPLFTPQNAQDAPPEFIYKLEGTVVNAQTGRPIPRALVEVFITGRQAVLTGPQGEFAFDKLPNGTTGYRVTKPGFFEPSSRNQRNPLQRVEIGPDTGKVILKLEPECVVSGEVLDGEGEPVEGAVVEALTFRVNDGRRMLMPTRSNVRTDEDGLFRMAGLQSGKYFIGVRAGPAARRTLAVQALNGNKTYPAVVYFPGVPDTSSTTPIDLAPGQHMHMPFTLAMVPAFKLAGTVTGASSFKQVSNPMIVDAMQRPLFVANRWDRQTGLFEFPPLPAGSYNLRIFALTEDNHQSWLNQTVVVGRDMTNLNLALQAGGAISVSVRSELTSATQPFSCTGEWTTASGARVDCSKVTAMVALASAESMRMEYQAEPDVHDPANLVFHGVMPGRYHVRVMPMRAAYVRSVRSGGADLLREELVVPAGGSVPPIEVLLRDDGADVKVHVQSDKPLDHARVLLLPDFAPFQPAQTLDVDSGGNREYSGLAPGNYKVLAFDSIDTIEYGNPEVLEKYSSKTAHVTLSANGSASVNVELIKTGE